MRYFNFLHVTCSSLLIFSLGTPKTKPKYEIRAKKKTTKYEKKMKNYIKITNKTKHDHA